MFHFTQAPAYRTSTPLSPRERYLDALAQFKSAEAEYRADNVQREEERLLRQLEELQLSKRREQVLRSRYDTIPSYGRHATSGYHLDIPFGSFAEDQADFEHDRLALARRQLESEERVRIAAAFKVQEQRRRQAEEARILLALEHQQEEEDHQRILLRRQREWQQRRTLGPCKHRQAVCACRSENKDSQHALRLLFGDSSEATAAYKERNVVQTPPRHCCRSPREPRQKPHVVTDLEQFLQAITDNQRSANQQNSVPVQRPSTQGESRVAEQQVDIQQFLGQFFKKHAEKEEKPHASTSNPEQPRVLESDGLQQILNLFLGGEADHRSESEKSEPQPASRPAANGGQGCQEPLSELHGSQSENKKEKVPCPSACRSDLRAHRPEESLQDILNLVFGGHPGTRVQTKEPENPQTQAQPSAATQPASTGSSLKQDLEARLNNDESVEIRDTINAILASLADPSASAPTAGPTSGPATGATDKGKAKQVSFGPAVVTSKDVVQSMDAVRNIEAAFFALESDFTFPSQLDFSPSSSPASSDSESLTSRLAFTSRNHPVRFYEQALSALLGQLDSVESFGNEELRGRRKEVVGKVEKALEELESGVEGKWRLKIGKPVSEPAEVDVTDRTTVDEPVVDSEPVSQPTAPTSSEESSTHDYVEVATAPSTPEIEAIVETEAVGTTEENATASEEKKDLSSVDISAATSSDLDATLAPSSVAEESITNGVVGTDDIPESGPQAIDDFFNETSGQDHADQVDEVNSDTELSAQLSATASSSVGTIRPYDATPAPKTEPEVDTFLLPASSEVPKAVVAEEPEQDGDAGSDWSEVEA